MMKKGLRLRPKVPQIAHNLFGPSAKSAKKFEIPILKKNVLSSKEVCKRWHGLSAAI